MFPTLESYQPRPEKRAPELVEGCARLEGRPQARSCRWPSFVLREPQDGRPSKSAVADFDTLRLPKSGKPDFGARPPQDEVRILGRSIPLRAGGERLNEIHVAGVTSPLRRASALLRHLVVVAAFERDPVGLQVLRVGQEVRPRIAGDKARGLPYHVELAV